MINHLGRQNGTIRSTRRGAAMVEFALIAPLLFSILLGILEFGRASMVYQILNNAARTGARAATLPGATSNSITTLMNKALQGITGTTITITVNDLPVDVSQAVSGDLISIKMTVPYTDVSWVGKSSSYLNDAKLSATAMMVRE